MGNGNVKVKLPAAKTKYQEFFGGIVFLVFFLFFSFFVDTILS